MKYDFTIQPNPVRIPGIEAENDVQASNRLQDIMDTQTDRVLEAVRHSRWTVTLVRTEETYIHTEYPDTATDTETPIPDPGVEATEKSEARTDNVLEENLFE